MKNEPILPNIKIIIDEIKRSFTWLKKMKFDAYNYQKNKIDPIPE
jgi:hypothetical protein